MYSVEIVRIYILLEVSLMLTHLALPIEGHIEKSSVYLGD